MYGLRKRLVEEKEYLSEIIEKAKSGEKRYPDGKLRISKDKGNVRFYHCKEGDCLGIYIPKANEQLPRELAQKTYDATVIKKAEGRLKQIERILLDYKDDEIERIYLSCHENRKALIMPVEQTDEQRIKQWLEEPYTGKEFLEGAPLILTERGERVRSKSEKILADYFFAKGIPYLYEKPLYLNGYGIVYPDFTFYSRRLRKEIYWEHEGMMDSQEYARMAVKKINSYQMNGIFPGERLILTYETTQDVIDSKLIKTLTARYLLND
ncbi:MAG: hypothetical protein J5546_09120 [Lachnospiraceae bacterium]|nr:hypothetical protein [Lachnospiraceae bacterium]